MSGWCWRRWIVPGAQDDWIARLPADAAWMVTEKPGAKRCRLVVHFAARREAERLACSLGGQVVKVAPWKPAGPARSLRIGKLEIRHRPARGDGLYIPHGLAFGSGEHSTTLMLLRALVRRRDFSSVLDLGTGSGILALAARKFGAREVAGLDFDADSIRTARENEGLNFREAAISWRRGDVLKLPAGKKYELVLANLFSGLLIEAAPGIARRISGGGELWMTGILRAQEKEVAAAYRKQKLHFVRAVRRGKWVMLQWRKAGAKRARS